MCLIEKKIAKDKQKSVLFHVIIRGKDGNIEYGNIDGRKR